MKQVIAFTFLLLVGTVSAQTLTDIAVQQNISHVQNAANHWANGGSFYDFDADGWDDLVLPVTNDSLAFYKNNQGNLDLIGSYIYAPGKVRQITWVDFNDDGNIDLCVTFHDIGIRLYQNDGNFNFIENTSSWGVSTTPFSAYGVAFADADGDNDLDFYVCAYETVQVHGPNASRNLYYINQNNQSFVESAQAKGIDNGAQPSFMPVWFDYDNDGDLDLHIINDREYSGNAMFQNNNGNFLDVTDSTGLKNYGHNPMSNSISDFDNDGDFDIFESDVANGAISNGTPVDYKLYKNNGGISFMNASYAVGLDTNFFAWGALWIDYDNDSFEDLYIATSFTDAQTIHERPSVFYHNNGGVNFTNYNDSLIANLVCSSYSPLKGDINNDGFYDIIVVNDGVPSHVFLNSGNANNHIKLTPQGTVSNNAAIGARIEVYANGQHQTQQVLCGQSICSQNSQHLIFGIGTAPLVDSVIVTFPSGIIMKEFNLPANQNYTIKEKTTMFVPVIQGQNFLQKCAGDTVVLGTSGWTNYQWSTGSTNPTIAVTSTGYYNFSAENTAGDTIFQSYDIFVNFNQPLVYQEIVTDANCGNNSVGMAEISVAQPSLVDSIIWSNGTLGPINNSLSPGTYPYTIVSIHGCVQMDDVTIQSTPLFSTQYVTSPQTDTIGGSIQFFIWGGTAPFTYLLDTTYVTNTVTDLDAGNYQMIITDALGCSDTIAFQIDDATTTTGIQEQQIDTYSVYLANEQLYVCNDQLALNPSQITVYDMTGKQVMDHAWNQQEIHCVYRPCDLPIGLYQVRIQGSNSVVSKTLFIH